MFNCLSSVHLVTHCIFCIDGAVQTEVVEQLPSIAVHCREQRQFYSDVVPTYVLPIVVKCLKDCNIQVLYVSVVIFTLQICIL